MKILFAAAEAAPFIKVGGLGDVIGGLPKALAEKGEEVRVIIPLYRQISEFYKSKMNFLKFIYVQNSWRKSYCGIFSLKQDGVIYYFLDNEQYFHRDAIYGAYDEGEIFAFFSRAVLEILPALDFIPDIIHVHDWHTAILPVYLNAFYRSREEYKKIKTVLSIHNIEFQGKFNPYNLGQLFGLDEFQKSVLMYDGDLNVLKGGIEASNLVLTVSKSYAEEILGESHSFGMHHILNARREKISGIGNGIDTAVYNPETDRNLRLNYSVSSIENKRINKIALQTQMGLSENENLPIIGMVSRLTAQKGLELVHAVMHEIEKLDLQFVVLGSGDPAFENMFREWEGRRHDKIRGVIKYDAALSSQIYAGADFFLMPSKSEPCGIAQMIAMRYGTIPVVHSVGGLRDTVEAYNPEAESGTGITFQSFNAYDMLDAIKRALEIYKNQRHFETIRKNAMKAYFGWGRAAEEYINAYRFVLYKEL